MINNNNTFKAFLDNSKFLFKSTIFRNGSLLFIDPIIELFAFFGKVLSQSFVTF